jgi:hypothetical protein
MVARFEISQDTDGRFHFQLRASDGSVLLNSLPGDSKIMAQNEILHARNAVRDPERIVPHHAQDGHFLVLKDRDGSVLARSPRVDSAAALDALAVQIRDAASAAGLVDTTKRKHHPMAS